MSFNNPSPSQAQISRAAINRLHVAMRHLFLRGSYKPLGVSGESMINAMLDLKPEIYGSIGDDEKVELSGLLYIFQRIPQGIEECRYINLIGREGYEDSEFEAIVPSKRRRNCYRIDQNQMFVEMTRGRSDIYDILTHLTFLYIEAEKIRRNSLDSKGRVNRAWKMLKKAMTNSTEEDSFKEEVGFTYLSTILGRTYEETRIAYEQFNNSEKVNNLFSIAYHMGQLSMDEYFENEDREITFSSALRENLGHHIYGEKWANNIKSFLYNNQLIDRNIHIISANLHSVMNLIYGKAALRKDGTKTIDELASVLSTSKKDQETVYKYAKVNGLTEIHDSSGTNISVQIIDCSKIDLKKLPVELQSDYSFDNEVLIVMDYAFGEQAYETMDELLKPYEPNGSKKYLQFKSINIMGKAGILSGKKGDIMIPNAHIFEGSADNYPFVNRLTEKPFKEAHLGVMSGPMITVLGTSLQNKDILRYFMQSSWGVIGLEMEGAHYQKAIQAASQIRNNIASDVQLRYAYYASDNPLETGATLASGSLGLEGIKPTYIITREILRGIFS